MFGAFFFPYLFLYFLFETKSVPMRLIYLKFIVSPEEKKNVIIKFNSSMFIFYFSSIFGYPFITLSYMTNGRMNYIPPGWLMMKWYFVLTFGHCMNYELEEIFCLFLFCIFCSLNLYMGVKRNTLCFLVSRCEEEIFQFNVENKLNQFLKHIDNESSPFLHQLWVERPTVFE